MRVDFRKLRLEQSLKTGVEFGHSSMIKTEKCMQQRTVEKVGETNEGIGDFQIEQKYRSQKRHALNELNQILSGQKVHSKIDSED